MKKVRYYWAACWLLSVLPLSSALAATDVEFVLDISGSMRQQLGSETQMESARKALLQALDQIPAGQKVAVRVYGHRVEQSNKEESCKDTELLIPFQEVNKKLFDEKISALVPRGYTPIAYSLQETRNDLYDVGISREAERVIILLTDGEETCDGDPIAVLKQLRDEGFKLKVFTVGFNVNEVARKQLQEIAEFTGGRYFDAKNAVQLNSALKEAALQSALIQKERKSYGEPIRGGDNYEEAVPIEFGKEYKLDHHQQKSSYDYFSFDADTASEIRVVINTTDRGITNLTTTALETAHPYAGVQVHDQRRNQVKHVDILGDKFKTAEFAFRPTENGRHYLLVGTEYGDIHKDYFTFKMLVEVRGDADGDKDAGDGFDAALPIEAKRYQTNHIGAGDALDLFSFNAKKGEQYLIGIAPNSKNKYYFTIRVVDEFRQSIYNGSSKAGEGIRSPEILIPEDGPYYIEVGYSGDDLVPYSLVIRKREPAEGGGAAGPNQ